VTHLATALDRALGILEHTQDLVAARPVEGDAPEWATRRGWRDYLSNLSDEQVHEAERDPASWLAAQPLAPGSLRAIAREAAALGSHFRDVSEPERRPLERNVKRRKQVQLDAFSAVAQRTFAGVTRIVDLGAGHGHLTRALARALRPDETLGVDWDDERIARAIDLAGEGGPRFVHADANREEGAEGDWLTLDARDLVVGLHPCGDLGDALVSRAREAGAHVLAVSCCFQETQRSARDALSEQAQRAGFSVPKHALGLANLSPVSFEGSGSLAEKRAWRQTRLALRLLLEARGVELAPGAEGRGVPKDRLRQGLGAVATLSLAKRGLPPATAPELAEASVRAATAHADIARLALPRHALARVLELAIVLDRARLLEEGGWRTDVVTLFSSRTSPRNLAIVAVAPDSLAHDLP
jgi:SAM-dependent methyltransferase